MVASFLVIKIVNPENVKPMDATDNHIACEKKSLFKIIF